MHYTCPFFVTKLETRFTLLPTPVGGIGSLQQLIAEYEVRLKLAHHAACLCPPCEIPAGALFSFAHGNGYTYTALIISGYCARPCSMSFFRRNTDDTLEHAMRHRAKFTPARFPASPGPRHRRRRTAHPHRLHGPLQKRCRAENCNRLTWQCGVCSTDRVQGYIRSVLAIALMYGMIWRTLLAIEIFLLGSQERHTARTPPGPQGGDSSGDRRKDG